MKRPITYDHTGNLLLINAINVNKLPKGYVQPDHKIKSVSAFASKENSIY